jgi:prepilin-type processing-associated H-X9-DG protein
MKRFLRIAPWVLLAIPVLVAVAMARPHYLEQRAKETDRANFKAIGVAMQAYYQQHKHLPPAVAFNSDGTIPRSWRVELLPFLGQADLYRDYRQDEPWDSPHNLTLLPRMPAVYRSSRDPKETTSPGYFAFTGPKTAFGPVDGLSDPEVTDGWSNIVMAAEAKREIPWTKPEDLPFDETGPLPDFGKRHGGGAHMLMADGNVRFIGDTLSVERLRHLINACDGDGSDCEF